MMQVLNLLKVLRRREIWMLCSQRKLFPLGHHDLHLIFHDEVHGSEDQEEKRDLVQGIEEHDPPFHGSVEAIGHNALALSDCSTLLFEAARKLIVKADSAKRAGD